MGSRCTWQPADFYGISIRKVFCVCISKTLWEIWREHTPVKIASSFTLPTQTTLVLVLVHWTSSTYWRLLFTISTRSQTSTCSCGIYANLMWNTLYLLAMEIGFVNYHVLLFSNDWLGCNSSIKRHHRCMEYCGLLSIVDNRPQMLSQTCLRHAPCTWLCLGLPWSSFP